MARYVRLNERVTFGLLLLLFLLLCVLFIYFIIVIFVFLLAILQFYYLEGVNYYVLFLINPKSFCLTAIKANEIKEKSHFCLYHGCLGSSFFVLLTSMI